MIIATKRQKYRCANCQNLFDFKSDDPILCKIEAFCSLLCLVKNKFGTTPEIIYWLIKEHWSNN